MPVATVACPVPSRLRVSVICVSVVVRRIVAVRAMAVPLAHCGADCDAGRFASCRSRHMSRIACGTRLPERHSQQAGRNRPPGRAHVDLPAAQDPVSDGADKDQFALRRPGIWLFVQPRTKPPEPDFPFRSMRRFRPGQLPPEVSVAAGEACPRVWRSSRFRLKPHRSSGCICFQTAADALLNTATYFFVLRFVVGLPKPECVVRKDY